MGFREKIKVYRLLPGWYDSANANQKELRNYQGEYGMGKDDAAVKGSTGWPRIAGRYALAVVLVALAVLARRWLVGGFGPMPLFITFYPAVLIAAAVAGGGPGITATILSGLAANYWFIDPYSSFAVYSMNDAIALGIFIGVGLVLSILLERLRRSQWIKAVNAAQEQELALLNMGNLVSLDPDNRIVHWSTGCCRVYGFDVAEAQGRDIDDLLHTRSAQPLEQIRRDLMTHNHWEGEFTRRRKDGAPP
jgi:PAS domain-containing protein